MTLLPCQFIQRAGINKGTFDPDDHRSHGTSTLVGHENVFPDDLVEIDIIELAATVIVPACIVDAARNKSFDLFQGIEEIEPGSTCSQVAGHGTETVLKAIGLTPANLAVGIMPAGQLDRAIVRLIADSTEVDQLATSL